MNYRWAIVAAAIAAFGGWACGLDAKDAESSDICKKGSASFDEKACAECEAKASACWEKKVCDSEENTLYACGRSKCDSEYQAGFDCEEVAYASCSDQDLSEDDFDACMISACAAERTARESCVRSNCPAEVEAYFSCVEGG